MDAAPLVTWARRDLFTAYEPLTLVMHWPGCIEAQWIRDSGGEVLAVAIRWECPSPEGVAFVRYHYAATDAAALDQAISALPPEGECVVCAPDTEAHRALRRLGTVVPEEVYYEWGGGAAPAPALDIVEFSAEEAIAAGLTAPWHWPSILGRDPAARPIHCIVEEKRVIAVASAGCVTPFTEEVRGAWVQGERRRQGLGREVVASVTRAILARGRLPTYTHEADNLPSQRLAESIGYVRRGAFLRLECAGA